MSKKILRKTGLNKPLKFATNFFLGGQGVGGALMGLAGADSGGGGVPMGGNFSAVDPELYKDIREKARGLLTTPLYTDEDYARLKMQAQQEAGDAYRTLAYNVLRGGAPTAGWETGLLTGGAANVASDLGTRLLGLKTSLTEQNRLAQLQGLQAATGLLTGNASYGLDAGALGLRQRMYDDQLKSQMFQNLGKLLALWREKQEEKAADAAGGRYGGSWDWKRGWGP
jgi:hypothetical protein